LVLWADWGDRLREKAILQIALVYCSEKPVESAAINFDCQVAKSQFDFPAVALGFLVGSRLP